MISAPKKPTTAVPAEPLLQKLDTNEQGRPLPYFAGRRWFPLWWLCSQVYNPTTTPVSSKVGKSTHTTGYIYGGDIAGLVCLGPVDYLEQIEVDGDVIWSAGLSRDGAHVDSTGDIVVPGVGTFRLYWGTETQTLDTLVLSGSGESHPNYLGQCYLVAKSLVFGQGRTTPPNIRVLVERAARFGGLLDENRSREGANPVTALAEVVGDDFFGLGRPDLVDVTSWAALGTAIQRSQTQPVPGDPTHTAVMGYCSPYVESVETLQSFAGKILENFDGWIRRKPGAGTLEIGRFPHDGVVPTGLTELTLHEFIGQPQFSSPGFNADSVITDVVVHGLDRDWRMEASSQPGVNSAARQRLGERRIKSFQRSYLHTSYQARAQANELVNFYARPETAITVKVRREKALALFPGDRFLLNYAPSAVELLCRVTGRRDPGAGGTIDLTIVAERGVAPLGFVSTAPAAPNLPAPPPPAAIAAARLLQLPIGFLADPAPAIVPLAARPSVNTLGLDLYFSTDDATYDPIAQTKRWALHGSLAANITTATASFNVNASGPELALLATQSGPAQTDDTLLLVVGYELFSIGAVTAVGGGVYTVAVLRGRRGSAAAAHSSGDEVYIIPRGDLEIVQHAQFPRTVTTDYFKLRAFTPQDEQLLSAALRIVFAFAAATTAVPTGFSATAQPEGVALLWALPVLADGAVDPTIIMIEIAELAHGASAPGSSYPPDFSILAAGYNRPALPSGTAKDYYIRARDTIDDQSAWVGPQTATALPATTVAGVTAETAARIAADTAIALTADGKNRSFYQTTAPSGSPGGIALAVGDLWFNTADGYHLYRYNGSAWIDAQRVIAATDFGTGIQAVGIVTTLPSPTGYTGPSVVLLTSDNQLYRYTGTAWTLAIPAVNVTGTLTDAQLAAIAAAKITGQIVTTQITDNAISTAKLAAGAVTANEIAANTITAAKIAAGAVTANEIAAGAITTAKLAAGAVTANEIAANTITAGKIAAGAIDATTVGANQIITSAANIADAVITNAKIVALDAGKITAGSITVALALSSGGSLTAGTGANRFYADSTGTIVGSASGKHAAINGNNSGYTSFDLYDGTTWRGGLGFVSGTPYLGFNVADSPQLNGLYVLNSQIVKALSTSDPRTTDAPLYTPGGAWIEKSLDVRGVGYFNSDLHVVGTLYPASINGASGGYTVPMYSGANNISLKYDSGLDLAVIRVDATDFISARAGAYTGSTVTHAGYVTMKDSSGTDRKFMIGT